MGFWQIVRTDGDSQTLIKDNFIDKDSAADERHKLKQLPEYKNATLQIVPKFPKSAKNPDAPKTKVVGNGRRQGKGRFPGRT
jgi:hypothetical protein